MDALADMPAPSSATPDRPHVFVILVNWNRWQDTVECLDSVYRIPYAPLSVVVADNASTDGSIDRIREWAEGRLAFSVPPGSPLRQIPLPPCAIPRACRTVKAGDPDGGVSLTGSRDALVVIDMGRNQGYAAANNAAIRLARSASPRAHLWLVNNDTVVRPDALTPLLVRISEDPRIGLCGSTLLFYDRPETVQARAGAHYRSALGTARQVGLGTHRNAPFAHAAVESRLSYIAGASLFVTPDFV